MNGTIRFGASTLTVLAILALVVAPTAGAVVNPGEVTPGHRCNGTVDASSEYCSSNGNNSGSSWSYCEDDDSSGYYWEYCFAWANGYCYVG